MARLARLFLPGCAQHIIQYATPNTILFQDSQDYEFFLSVLQQVSLEHHVAIHAYTLLPTHLHLLLSAENGVSTSKMMQSLGRRYVQYFNRKYRRLGGLWQGRYRATSIENERYLLSCSRYIELNPVRAGLVAQPAFYPWSSYNGNIGVSQDMLLTPHQEYWRLGDHLYARQIAYKHFVAQGMSYEEFNAITTKTKKGWMLASETFIQAHMDQASRRMTQAKRGRPRKTDQDSDISVA